MRKTGDFLLEEVKTVLTDLYGDLPGKERFEYLKNRVDSFFESKTETQSLNDRFFDSDKPYESLKGRIFAISYPDSVYDDKEYTLKTLGKTLQKYFPPINGIHILPERTMSHEDVWPQDFFSLYPVDLSNRIMALLREMNIIDENRIITSEYEAKINLFLEHELKDLTGEFYDSTKAQVQSILDRAYNSHFNDGGFSQKTRAMVDPRFGSNRDIKEISERFSTMLDFVVNHLDVDNDYLENYRKGLNGGDAFIIISRDKYKQLRADRTLEKTFRPRPFPLFTGMRKYPAVSLEGESRDLKSCAHDMNKIFSSRGLEPLDERLILFLALYFKVENDQGLTAQDKRIFQDFLNYTGERGINTELFWLDSPVQAKQKIFNPRVIDSMGTFLQELSLDKQYADLFIEDCDRIFGMEFYIYTTFSESQADLNPLSFEGFKMIVDDLFHLLSSGSIKMMRMDAIKYLWKEIGEKNFDMPQGNKLIGVIRLIMELASPSTLPLDEVNSPDRVVYDMTRGGGFAYLFGQVNTIPVAINEGNLAPLNHFQHMRKELGPKDLLAFVMLSTHDGRSVQGLGVQHEDSHVTFEQFHHLVKTAQSRGGRLKDRSVTAGEIAGETFRKAIHEAGLSLSSEKLHDLFEEDLRVKKDIIRLKNQSMTESDLWGSLARKLNVQESLLKDKPGLVYFVQWIIYGRTVYEICATSRSSFSRTDCYGNRITPEEEAQRLALAQLFVLTQGQDVPAIYFNDLLGLENDVKHFELTGQPRDLIRHKNRLDHVINLMENDPFTRTYSKKLNPIIKLRSEDGAFYPGSRQFEYLPLSDQVFLNHPYHGGNHSFILGNIVNREEKIMFDMSKIKGFQSPVLIDQLTGETYSLNGGFLSLTLKPFGYLWLK